VIHCFDKTNSKQFIVNIGKIAGEKYFYDLGDKTYELVEKILSKYEKIFDDSYYKLVTKKHLGYLDWKERESIACFLATQEIRTKETREDIRNIAKELKRFVSKHNPPEEFKKKLDILGTEKSIRSAQLKLLLETLTGKTKFVDIILKMKWILIENNTKMPFWTSDHPVNRINPYDWSPYGNLGLLSQGIQIYFPLTSKLSLSIVDPIEYYFNPIKMGADEDHVLFQNTLQVRSSTRHIFSRKNDFSVARKWLNENPTFRDLSRERLSVGINHFKGKKLQKSPRWWWNGK
jgi:hypothetical protein